MTRKFRTADYEKTLDLQISLRAVLPPDHLARFIVDLVAQLDLSEIYNQYSDQGAPPYAPKILFGWEQNPCRCFQEQSGQLQAIAGYRGVSAS